MIKRTLLSILTVAVLFVGWISQPSKIARAETCRNFLTPEEFPGQWFVEFGTTTPGVMPVYSVSQNADYVPAIGDTRRYAPHQQRVRVWFNFGDTVRVSSITFHIWAAGWDMWPMYAYLSLYVSGQLSGNFNTFTFNTNEDGQQVTSAWPNQRADIAVVDIKLPYDTDTVDPFFLQVEEICYEADFNTLVWNPPTSTPPPTSTNPAPTSMPIPSSTATRTRTPAPSGTPVPTITPGGPTLTPSNTLPPTYNYDGPTSPPTFSPDDAIGVQNPFNSPTPRPPNNGYPFQGPNFPTLQLPSPTPIPFLPTLTLIPAVIVTGTPNSMPVAIAQISTQIGGVAQQAQAWSTQIVRDGQGTALPSIANQANRIGSEVGGAFAVIRAIPQGIGRAGDIVLFLILLIAFNLLLRLFIFIFTVLEWLFRQAKAIFSMVFGFFTMILIVFMVVAMLTTNIHAQAQSPTATPTLTLTPTLLPINPTATSPYGYFRDTPTPYSIHPESLPNYFDTSGTTGTFADTIINGYRSFGAVADFISFIAMAAIAVMLLVRLFKRMNKPE